MLRMSSKTVWKSAWGTRLSYFANVIDGQLFQIPLVGSTSRILAMGTSKSVEKRLRIVMLGITASLFSKQLRTEDRRTPTLLASPNETPPDSVTWPVMKWRLSALVLTLTTTTNSSQVVHNPLTRQDPQ